MLGFELKFRDKILYLPLEAGLIVTRKSTDREEDMYIDVGLYDPLTNNIVNWLREELRIGDSIEVVIKHITLLYLFTFFTGTLFFIPAIFVNMKTITTLSWQDCFLDLRTPRALLPT